MTEVLRCLDRWHRVIILPEDNWAEKITPLHLELIGNELSVEQTLADPDIVAFDRDYKDREVYYRWGALPPPDHRGYLKVCVGFRTTNEGTLGRVITAYAVDRPKPGEKIKWKR